jgi:hypothetical protein
MKSSALLASVVTKDMIAAAEQRLERGQNAFLVVDQ